MPHRARVGGGRRAEARRDAGGRAGRLGRAPLRLRSGLEKQPDVQLRRRRRRRQARKDSQGICFLGKLKFDDFIRHHLGRSEGPVVDSLAGLQ